MVSDIDHIAPLADRTGSGERRIWRDALLLVLVLALWFGYELGSRSLWHPDEGRYSEIPREMVASGDYLTPRLNGVKYFEKPVLFYWLQAGAIRLFGVNEWSLRLWTAFFAGLGCVAVFFAGYRLYGRRAAWLSAGVLATAVWYDVMGSAITLDMAVTAFLTSALLAFLIGTREPPGLKRRLWLYGFYALAAAATLTKGLIGMVIPGMVIFAWMVLLGNWSQLRSLYLPTGMLLFLAIAAPWHVLVSRANPEFAHFYFIHEHFARYLSTVHQRSAPPWYFVPVLLGGMFPWSVFFFSAIRHGLTNAWADRKKHDDIWFLVLWAGLVFAFFSLSGSKLAAYILPAMPPLALLCGRYLSVAWERPGLLGRGYALRVVLVVGVAMSLVLLAARMFADEHARMAYFFEQVGSNLYALVASLMIMGIVPFVFARRNQVRQAIVSLLIASAFMVLVVDVSLDKFDLNRSVKPLAQAIKQHIKPGDDVVTFHHYYQDLPVYLERIVSVAGWHGELAFGMTLEDTSAWMLSDQALASRLQSGVVYIVTRLDLVEQLERVSPVSLRELMRSGRNVVLTNAQVGNE